MRDVVSLTRDPVDVDTMAHFLQHYMLHTAEFGSRERGAIVACTDAQLRPEMQVYDLRKQMNGNTGRI